MSNVVALPTRSLQIALTISDPEVIHELERRAEGAERAAYAAQALRLGVLALRQASGALDADVIRREGDQLVDQVRSVLHDRTSALSNVVMSTMLQYLDPATGALPQRLDRLTKPNGELEALLAKHCTGDQSTLAQTLARHIGEQSPIFKLLSPTQSDGLIAALTGTLKRALDGQRDEVLKQFSLDRKDSALSRLLEEVTSSNGKLRGELAEDVGKMVNEFSLDNQEGALTRLVKRVEEAQKKITNEFSLDQEGSAIQRLSSMLERTNEAVETSLTLDDEKSPLARLKREVIEVLSKHEETNAKFQHEVRSTLDTFKARREEAARSTLHGLSYEDQMGRFLECESERSGDVVERVGTLQGKSQRKVGDFVLTLGPESAAAGANIVFEAKANKRYTIKNALSELADARKNRGAQVGVFVFDRSSAPENMEALRRVELDVLVIWDAEDPSTDVYLKTAFHLARSLAHRERAAVCRSDADFAALDASIEGVAKNLSTLEAIEKAARAVRKNGDTILTNAERVRETLEAQVESLRKNTAALRGKLGG